MFKAKITGLEHLTQIDADARTISTFVPRLLEAELLRLELDIFEVTPVQNPKYSNLYERARKSLISITGRPIESFDDSGDLNIREVVGDPDDFLIPGLFLGRAQVFSGTIYGAYYITTGPRPLEVFGTNPDRSPLVAAEPGFVGRELPPALERINAILSRYVGLVFAK